MSASLVGSEMCIRDRCRHTARSGGRATHPPGRSEGKSDKEPSQPDAYACLLYTSDAADDM
eukprot:6921324-Alexandrium_andersonii.AAC.1